MSYGPTTILTRSIHHLIHEDDLQRQTTLESGYQFVGDTTEPGIRAVILSVDVHKKG
jgi:hypothetical protein